MYIHIYDVYLYIYIYKNIHTKKHTLHIHFFWMWLLGLSYPRQLEQFLRLGSPTEFTVPHIIINLQTPTRRSVRYPGTRLEVNIWFWSLEVMIFFGRFFFVVGCCWPTKQAIRKWKFWRTWVFLGAGGMRVEMCSAKFFFGKKKTTWNGWVYFPFSLN